MKRLALENDLHCLCAQHRYAGDNATMIAFAAYADPTALAQEVFSIEPSLCLAALQHKDL